MKEPFFEEYELRVYARVTVPRITEAGRISSEIFDDVLDCLSKRKDMLVALTSTTLEPLKGKNDERSKTSF